MTLTTLQAPQWQTANPAPPRPPASIRRTTSIDVTWPDGPGGERVFTGAARDALTQKSGSEPGKIAEAGFEARIGRDKTILSLKAAPATWPVDRLVGERGGAHLRLVLQERLPELVASCDPLYLLLDDISGTALVSPAAVSAWSSDAAATRRGALSDAQLAEARERMTDVCWGLARGNSGLAMLKGQGAVFETDGGELRNPADPEGWHAFSPVRPGPAFRRARRIDVTRDAMEGSLVIDSAFQDTGAREDGTRHAVHEYQLRAEVDAGSLEILKLEATPRVLPFRECPGAAGNIQHLVGRRLDDLRKDVLDTLRGTKGCTHLNDALRALADVPALAEKLAAGVS